MSKLASLFIAPEPASEALNAFPKAEAADSPYRVLFVDDEENVLRSMKRIFRQERYRILTALSGREALAIMELESVQVIVSDHRMPEMTGAELLHEVKKKHPDTIRIMLTGNADVNAIMGAVNEGAVYKFITKPWNDEDLRLTVSLALERYDLIRANRTLKQETAAQKKQIKELSRFVSVHRSQLGNLLHQEGLLTGADMERALAAQARKKQVMPQILVDMGLVDEKTILGVIQSKLRINRVFPNEFSLPRELASLVPKDVCEKNILIPLTKSPQGLVVAMADPTDILKIDDLKFITGMPVQPAVAEPREILDKIQEVFGDASAVDNVLSAMDAVDTADMIEIILDEDDETSDIDALIQQKDEPPAIRIVNAIISDALRHAASDVHIEPKAKYIMVRYRIDDLLQDKIHIPSALHLPIVSRIKIMSDLDITERRRPQDGRVTVKTPSRMVDMRISTLPTINGEKVVLRVLDKGAAVKELSGLGFSDADYNIVLRFVEQPQGIILATGPTGSGKTTTLYAMLRKGARITKNFTTIEDPVEYHMGMAEQVNVREKIGLTFPTVLRAILRQDPNVVMLGEIRDRETAEVAFQAALTGHLVLSTLHTNSSVATITRLRDMGMKSYVISDALMGIIAQRLVRRVCPLCAVPVEISSETLHSLGIYDPDLKTVKGQGCERCNGTGYRGRIGLYEVLRVDGEIKRMIHSGAPESEIVQAAQMGGMTTLFEDAVDKVRQRLTTCEEIQRVLGPRNVVDIRCLSCGAGLSERFPYCPFCGAVNMPRCGSCKHLLKPEWKVCPDCRTRVEANACQRLPG